MLQFIKDNSSMMVRMIVYQLAMSIFGFSLSMACAKNTTLLLISGIFAVGLYLFLLYFTVYESGQKDGIKIESGRLKFSPFKGLLVSLCANSLNFLLAILGIIGKASISNLGFFERVANLSPAENAALTPGWAVNLYTVCDFAARFLQCMYVGIAKILMPGNSVAVLLMPIPAVLICGAAYPLGVKYRSGFFKKKSVKSDRSR